MLGQGFGVWVFGFWDASAARETRHHSKQNFLPALGLDFQAVGPASSISPETTMRQMPQHKTSYTPGTMHILVANERLKETIHPGFNSFVACSRRLLLRFLYASSTLPSAQAIIWSKQLWSIPVRLHTNPRRITTVFFRRGKRGNILPVTPYTKAKHRPQRPVCSRQHLAWSQLNSTLPRCENLVVWEVKYQTSKLKMQIKPNKWQSVFSQNAFQTQELQKLRRVTESLRHSLCTRLFLGT